MASCSEYLELISRYVDGDLSADEAETLFEHLSHCPACSEALSSFEELRMMTTESMDHPPARLRDGVTASIQVAKKRPWYVRYRFTAVAAIFAVVVFAMSGTPLANLFSTPTENAELTVAKEPVVQPTTTISAAPKVLEDSASAESAPVQRAATEPKTTAPVQENAVVEDTHSDDVMVTEESVQKAESQAQETAQESDEDAAAAPLMPGIPFSQTFAQHLFFSAQEAPEILYSITSEQTVDNAIFYIVDAQTFSEIQTALLESGVDVSITPGDAESSEYLIVLTILE